MPPRAAQSPRDRSLRPLLAIIAVVLVIAGLRASASVTMPLAFAIFVALLAAPLQTHLCRHLPRVLAFVLTLLAVTAVFAGFVAGLGQCVDEIVEGADRYRDALDSARDRLQAILGRAGLDVELGSGAVDGSQLGTAAQGVGRQLVDATGQLVLAIGFVVLALYEAPRWHDKALALLGGRDGGDHVEQLLHRLTRNFRRYFGTRTLTSAITGVLTGLFTWVLGLDFPLVWGFSSFLLNYIPTLGSVVAIVPPSLLAYVQFGSLWMALAVFGGLATIQLALGSFIDPRLQSRFVDVSGLVVLISVALWGWIWGIPGALLGVPIAITIILVTDDFRATRWIGTLLTERGADRDDADAGSDRGG